VYTIGAFSNTGKSQFSYAYVAHFLKQGKKVGYFSIEVDVGMLLSHIAKSYYGEHYQNIMMGTKKVIRDDFQNLYLYEDVFTVKDIHKITELEKFDVIFIDYIQALHGKGDSATDKFEQIAYGIQRVAIETNCVVFSISQVNNESRGKA
jgi:predicted ATP-dependent serine protease